MTSSADLFAECRVATHQSTLASLAVGRVEAGFGTRCRVINVDERWCLLEHRDDEAANGVADGGSTPIVQVLDQLLMNLLTLALDEFW